MKRPGRVLGGILAVLVSGAMLLFLRGGTDTREGLLGLAVFLVVWGVSAFVVWFFLFSGRVRTATPRFRSKLWHALFLGFFTVYTAGLGAWLLAGLVPGIAHHSHGLHDRLHTYGGAPRMFDVRASEIGPFAIEGSRRIREMTLRAGAETTIRFTNAPTDEGLVFPHNLSILTPEGLVIFTGERITPTPAVEGNEDWDAQQHGFTATEAHYIFSAPQEGEYIFRCDVHPQRMRGTVVVVGSAVPQTDPLVSQSFRDMARRMAEVSHQAEDVGEIALDYAFSVLSLGLGIFLVVLRPRERMARIFGLAMVGTAAAYNLQSHSALAASASFEDPLHGILHPLTGIMYIYALVLFPDGRLIPRWSNRLVRLGFRFAVFIAFMILLGVTGGFLPDFGQHPAALVLVFGMLIPIIGMVAQGYRIRRADTSEKRQQSRLLVWALSTSLGLGIVLLLALGIDLGTLIRPTVGDPTAIGGTESLAFRVFQPLFVVIPIALFAGILRFRLWDIDLVISRTLVYGTLAGFIGALYVGLVVVLGGSFGGRTWTSIAATVLAAVAFDPLRSRVQRLANRLVYGERASPYEVMAEVSHRLAGAASADEVLPVVAETAGRGVGAARARVRMSLGAGDSCEAVWPADSAAEMPFDRVIPVVHLGEEVGEIAVAKRPGDPLRPAENRLLEALAGNVGLAMQSVRLADELRTRLHELERAAGELAASRRRLVRAADAERRRLEQLIHESIEHQLVVMSEALASAESKFAQNRAEAISLLEHVAVDANHTQEALRDLARGIFPPLLTDKGVGSAIESHVRKLPASVSVLGSIGDRFDARAEAAVYFCCVEALRRAARGNGATQLTVEFARENGWVRFAVRGGDGTLADGGELQLLVDRVEAVGGSLDVRSANGETEVAGRVPAQVAAAQTSTSRSGSNDAFGT